jgi:hypothetical protein
VRANSQNGERIAYGHQVSFVAECSSTADDPGATDVVATNFTANWIAMGGETSYRGDVSTNANFLGGTTEVAAWHNGTLGGGPRQLTDDNLLQSRLRRVRTNAADLGTPALYFNVGPSDALVFKARISAAAATATSANKITVSISTNGGARGQPRHAHAPQHDHERPWSPSSAHDAATIVRVRLRRSVLSPHGAGVVA